MATISRANLYHVPADAWKQWDVRGHQTFNMVYSTMRANQDLFRHPEAMRQSRTHWQTVCYNSAWTAASAASGLFAITDGERVAP